MLHIVFSKVAWALNLIGFKSPSALCFLSCARISYVLNASSSESNTHNSWWAAPYSTISINFTVIFCGVISNTQKHTQLTTSCLLIHLNSKSRRKKVSYNTSLPCTFLSMLSCNTVLVSLIASVSTVASACFAIVTRGYCKEQGWLKKELNNRLQVKIRRWRHWFNAQGSKKEENTTPAGPSFPGSHQPPASHQNINEKSCVWWRGLYKAVTTDSALCYQEELLYCWASRSKGNQEHPALVRQREGWYLFPVALQANFCLKDQKSAPKVSRPLQPSGTKPTAPLVLMQSVNALCTDLANIYLCVHRCQVWNAHGAAFNSRRKGNDPAFTNDCKIMLLWDSGASHPPKCYPKCSESRC